MRRCSRIGNGWQVGLLINIRIYASKVKFYLESNGFTMPVTSRIGNLPSEIFNGTLPTTVILNKQGHIVFRHEGIAAYDHPAFLAQLKALM